MQYTASNLPDDYVEITNQVNAKTFLAEIGILGDFRHFVPGKPHGQILRYLRHETHWILAVLWLGHSDQSQDGYYIYCFPRGKFTEEMFEACRQKFISLSQDGSGDGHNFSQSPDRN